MAKSTGKSVSGDRRIARQSANDLQISRQRLSGRSQHRPRPRPAGRGKGYARKVQGRAVGLPGRQRRRRFRADLHRPAEKKKQVRKLKSALKDADNLYLATDEDREGEAISWHLHELLKPKVPVHRLVFHEITKEAIQHALESTARSTIQGWSTPRKPAGSSTGCTASMSRSCCGKKSAAALSAGRVQSVAVRLIVERERERIAFVESTYWDLEAVFQTGRRRSRCRPPCRPSTAARFPRGKDFRFGHRKAEKAELLQLDEASRANLAGGCARADFRSPRSRSNRSPSGPGPRSPPARCSRKPTANWASPPKRTMRAAQKLYENGYITYMRTDSTTLSNRSDRGGPRTWSASEYGEDFLHPEVRSTRQGQERPRGSRGDPAGRNALPLAGHGPGRTRFATSSGCSS
jgi:DNA topoisomerase I